MDPNTARMVLRLDADAPLSPAAVEAAFARESWERHPSRYPDTAGRDAATAWAATLAQARAVLLQSMSPPDVAQWAPPVSTSRLTTGTPAAVGSRGRSVDAIVPNAAPGPGADMRNRRRRRVGVIAGIVAASAGVIAVVVGAAFGATMLVERVVDASTFGGGSGSTADGDVERYSADETYFTFRAELEEYSDGRFAADCPAELRFGCWENAIITEASCASVEVDLQYSNDDVDWVVEDGETLSISDVEAGELTPVVFGHDDYDFGWISDVRCVDEGTAAGSADAGPSTSEHAASTPLARLEAGRWAFEDTGFRFRASLEAYDDGRLDAWCPAGFDRGCWQAALIPQASCGSLEIQYSLGNGGAAEQTESTWRPGGVVAGEPVEVVFGNDDYEYGWISQVSCLA